MPRTLRLISRPLELAKMFTQTKIRLFNQQIIKMAPKLAKDKESKLLKMAIVQIIKDSRDHPNNRAQVHETQTLLKI